MGRFMSHCHGLHNEDHGVMAQIEAAIRQNPGCTVQQDLLQKNFRASISL
jgi:hypothetical protein